VLLSDRDLVAEIKAGNLQLDPFEPALIQPSSIDVRLDRLFRVFNNHLYTHIDPAQRQDELTTLIDVPEGDPFVLHPGEFVLASTAEVITLGDQLAGRLEGKALALDTEVPTPGGWRTMGDLHIGDYVFSQSGEPTEIIAATPPLIGGQCYEIVFSDNTLVIADAHHQWMTSTKSERKHKKQSRIRTTEEIRSTLRAGKEWNHHVPLAQPVQYPEQSLPIDPYTLGVWLGDGTSASAEITCVNPEILAHIRGAGYAVRPASGRFAYRVGGTGHSRDVVTGRYRRNYSLSSMLRTLGLLGNKHVPYGYLCGSVEQRLALLQGLMDSDGYCDEIGRCEFTNTREDLTLAVAELAASLGLRPKLRKKSAVFKGVDHGPAYQVKFVPDIPVFRLPRKLARQRALAKHRFRAIVDVRAVPSQPVRCIQVAAADGLFLIGRNYLPTHNSSLGRLGLLTHSTAGFIDPGFSGHVTLELSNVANLPITLWPGMKVGQLCIFRLSSPAEHPYGAAVYGSRYQGQRGPTPSRAWQNWRTWPAR
jgi:deoxycytidine triphosphate deaminase